MRSAAPPRARRAGIALAVLLLAAPLAAGRGLAQESSPAPAPSPTPVVVPVPEIASKAEETATRLRSIEASLEPSAEVQAIDAGSAGVAARISARMRDHAAALRAGPALRALAQMTATWQTERSTLAGWGATLTWYANEHEKQIKELSTLTDSWNATLEQARAANAPPAVIDRIQETLGTIRDTRRAVERYRTQILSLQDRVARETATCDEAIERIASFRKKDMGQMFVRDSEPLLGGLFAQREEGATSTAIRNALRDELAALPEFMSRAGLWILLQLLTLGVLSATFRQAQKRARTWVENDPGLDRASRIFGFPYSSALIVTVSSANWFYPWAPHFVSQLLGVVALVPVTRIVRALIQPRLVPALYALATFYLLDRVRDVVAPVPPLEQTILLFEMAAGIAVLLWMLRRGDLDAPKTDDDESAASSTLRIAARFVLAAFVVALACGLLGYMRLAHLVGGGTLIGAYLATALFACVRALDGLVAYALRARPLRELRMVRRHRPLLQAQVWQVLRWLGVIGWVTGALFQFQILEPIAERTTAVLTTTLSFGAISVTLGDVAAFALTVWLSFLLSRFVRFVLEEDVFPKIELARGVPYAISSLVHYVILIVGALLAFAAMGLDLNRFTILAGALGVGVGFGLQNVVNNFVSGLILLFERPIQVGDMVQIGSMSAFGEVRRIGIRSSTVRLLDGSEVIVPNATLISEPVTNWTLTDSLRRVELKVGIAYGNDPERVLQMLRGVLAGSERLVELPAPAVFFTGFGESSLDFVMYGWTDHMDQALSIKSELAIAVYRVLNEAGVEIPFPQRDLRVRAIDPTVARLLSPTRED